MTTAARSLRFLRVRKNCAAAAATVSTPQATIAATYRLPAIPRRYLSNTPLRSNSAQGRDGDSEGGRKEKWELKMEADFAASDRIMNITEAMRDMLSPEQRATIAPATPKETEKEARMIMELRTEFWGARRGDRTRKTAFWNEDEADTEMITDEIGEDEFRGDDITTMGHEKLDEHRERRHYARLAAWELPMLAKLAKPFEPPERDMALRFRYTSYMGEFHPAEKKVVVQFCPSDLDLTDVQQNKLKKLLGSRFNPETEVAHMSCEMFEHQAQNKRYLGDLIQKLVTEAKDPTDTFEDVPLDTRHHNFKMKPKFPKEWRMTEERRKELQEIRAQSFLLDQQKAADGTLVDGSQRIQAALAAPASEEMGGKIAELVRVSNRGGPSALRR